MCVPILLQFLREVKLLHKQQVIRYLITGSMTTLINTGTYYLMFSKVGTSNSVSVVVAWVLAVSFAFGMNKIWVFTSKSKGADLLYEISTFVVARFATGIMDLLIMMFTVDLLGLPAVYMKLGSNILVIVTNYFLSKLVVFKKKKRQIHN